MVAGPIPQENTRVPNTASSKKRMRQNASRREINRARRSAVKTQIGKFLDAVHDKDVERAKEEFRRVTKALDLNAAKGTYHKNTAARRKSRLAERLNALTTTPQAG